MSSKVRCESSEKCVSKRAKRQREREREREEETEYILSDLKSGARALYLQEVPKVKASHCRAWKCRPEERTGDPVIRSHYRFVIKDISGLHSNYNDYYHITCVERLLPDLGPLIRDGQLRMDGLITAPYGGKITLESSAEAIKDWFRYYGRTYDIACYEQFNKAHKEWERERSIRYISHQLGHKDQPCIECNYCQSLPGPEEPKRADYFPDEPSHILLSRLLASVSGQLNIDKGRVKRVKRTVA